MCGITGFFSTKLKGEKRKNTLLQMNEAIRHRGPDDEGYFDNERAALAMKRLSIIDLAGGKQPIFNETKTLVIIFNGEIYNYLEIKAELLKNGHTFETDSDTEVILHLFEEKGEAALDLLNGMFVFAIYNLLTDEIFIARDRFGIKPLYYSNIDNNFVFGSELKSIIKFPEIEKKIDPAALNYYFTFEHVPAPFSIFQNIKKLQAGHFLRYKNGSVTIKCWYTVSYQPKFTERNESFYINEIDKLLYQSVSKRTISHVPLGAFLSGGLDSSLIASYLSRISTEKVKTFTIGFSEKSFDESNYASLVAKHLHTEHHHKQFSTKEMFELMPQIFQLLDEPFADASLLPTFLLSNFTRQSVTVSLSGDGSDEVFGGYPTYYARKLARFIPPCAFPVLNFAASFFPVSDENISFDFKMKKFVQGIAYSGDTRHQIWLGAFDVKQKKLLFNREFIESRQIESNEILNEHMQNCNTENNWERSLWQDMRFYLSDNMLVKIDRVSMMNSLEARVPFLDHNLVDFATKIPAYLKYNGRTSKYILKKLAYKYLPAEIIERNKKGFGIPLAKWIKTDLKELFHETLRPEKLTEQGILNADFVNNLMNEHLKNKKDNRKLLWTIFVFQMWYNQFFK